MSYQLKRFNDMDSDSEREEHLRTMSVDCDCGGDCCVNGNGSKTIPSSIVRDIVNFAGEDGLKLRVNFPTKKFNETIFSINKDLADFISGKSNKRPKDKQAHAILALINCYRNNKLGKSKNKGECELTPKLMEIMKANPDIKGFGILDNFAKLIAQSIQKSRKGYDPLNKNFDMIDLLNSLAKDAITVRRGGMLPLATMPRGGNQVGVNSQHPEQDFNTPNIQYDEVGIGN